MEVINGEAYNIASPVTLDGNDIGGTLLRGICFHLGTLDDCTYKSGNVDKVLVTLISFSCTVVMKLLLHVITTLVQHSCKILRLSWRKEATESEPAVPGFVAKPNKSQFERYLEYL